MQALQEYVRSLFDQRFISTGLKTALGVGTLLFLINHGLALWRGNMDQERWASTALTYLMPYLVSVHGQYSQQRKLKHLGRR